MNVDSEFTVADQSIMAAAENYFLWQYKLVERFLGKRVLEIGCGIGNFTTFLKDRNCLVFGVDIDGQCIESHRCRFADRDNIRQCMLDAMSPEIEKIRGFEPDTIICLNVLEHIQDDRKALAHMFDVLRPGGKVCVIVPAYEALRGPIDNALGHYRRYTSGAIREVSLSAGFLITDLRYMNVVGFFGWWLNARVFKRTKQSPLQVRAFDRFIVPALHRMERMVPPPFGQNIFAVLEKPGEATS